MDDEQIWSIYFAGIASIRMHPRNDTQPGQQPIDTIQWSALVADLMLDEHHKRFPVEKGDR